MLTTTLAGSLPKPSWLADSTHQLFAPWVAPADRLREAQDDAVRLALFDQEEAGIDIVSDGEQRRRHYIWGSLDGHYRYDEETLAMHFAGLLNAEARALAAAGADVVQFDEPCFNIYLDKVKAWGIRALEAAITGVNCTTTIHICYSYGIPRVLAWKKQNTEWGQYGVTLPLLRETRINQISVECAASGVDVAALEGAQGKDILLGVIDVGTEEVETPALVASRIRKALPYVDPGRLFPCTDCGLVPRTRGAARAKLSALVEGTRIIRRELGR